MRKFGWLVCLLLIVTLTIGGAGARSRRKAGAAGPFDYYVLVLSYAPDFCDQPTGVKDPRECGTGRLVGFVVHGLWPQNDTGRGPENCGPASPVSQAIVQAMLRYIPTPSLIQHEWAAHGTCSGASAADYFAMVRRARDSVMLPANFAQPQQRLQVTPGQLEAAVAAANPQLPRGAIRTSCYRDGELEEVRICLNKDLSARACTASVGECTDGSIAMLP